MSPDGVAHPDESPHDPRMDARVGRLEDDLGDVIEPRIVRSDAILPHLATMADLMDVRTELKTEMWSVRSELKDEIADGKVALADKPSCIYMGGIMTTLVAAFACSLAGLAIPK